MYEIFEIIKYFQKYSNGLTVLLNIILLVGNSFILWLNTHQKFKLDKEIEKYKNQLQTEFIKSKLKTDQLFIIYPELFKKLKVAESSLVRLSILRGKNKPIPETESNGAEKDLTAFNNELAFKLLFLSIEIRNKCLELKDLMVNYLYEQADNFNEITLKIDDLESKMREELTNSESIYKDF